MLLFCPEQNFLKARIARNNHRIAKFFGVEGHDWKRINSFKHGLVDRLDVERGDIQTLDDLQNFIALRANLLQITAPRPMSVEDPERDLDILFSDIIGERISKMTRRNLRRYIGEQFNKAGLEKKLRRDIHVTVPAFDKEVEIPFGYQNGRLNLITPVRFEAGNPDQAIVTASRYAIEGDSLYKHPDPKLGELKLVVVGQFRSDDSESLRRVKRIFADYPLAFFRSSELPRLIDEIRQTAHDIQLH